MTYLSRIYHDLTGNPLSRAEALHLRRSENTLFQQFLYAAYVLTAFMLIAPLLWHWPNHFYRALSDDVVLLALMNVGAYLLIALKTASAAVDSVARERHSRTWDTLLITGIDSRRVVLGKWLGVLRGLWRDYAWLYILRLGVMFWASFYSSFGRLSWLDWRNVQLTGGFVNLDRFLLAGLIVLVYLALEMGLLAAIGLITSILDRSARQGVWITIALRIGIAIGVSVGLMYIPGLLRSYYNRVEYLPFLETVICTTSMSIADNSIISSVAFINDVSYSYYPEATRAGILVGQVAGMIPYILFTGIALRIAQVAAYRQGVNRPGTLMKIKPKRKLKDDPGYETASVKPAARPTASTNGRKKMAKTAPGAYNVFNITNPHIYRCGVHHYHSKLSRLYLRVFKGERKTPAFYLLFSDVGYIDAPANWQGANFQIASAEECLALMVETGLVGEATLDFPAMRQSLSEATRLYTVETDTSTIRIIAGSATLLQRLPPELE